jgi:hypothetical protein
MAGVAAKVRATSVYAGLAKIATRAGRAYTRRGGGRWKEAGSSGAAGARPRQGTDAAERGFRGETSPMNCTGRTAIHVPAPASRNMVSADRREPRCANRGNAGFAAVHWLWLRARKSRTGCAQAFAVCRPASARAADAKAMAAIATQIHALLLRLPVIKSFRLILCHKRAGMGMNGRVLRIGCCA